MSDTSPESSAGSGSTVTLVIKVQTLSRCSTEYELMAFRLAICVVRRRYDVNRWDRHVCNASNIKRYVTSRPSARSVQLENQLGEHLA